MTHTREVRSTIRQVLERIRPRSLRVKLNEDIFVISSDNDNVAGCVSVCVCKCDYKSMELSHLVLSQSVVDGNDDDDHDVVTR